MPHRWAKSVTKKRQRVRAERAPTRQLPDVCEVFRNFLETEAKAREAQEKKAAAAQAEVERFTARHP